MKKLVFLASIFIAANTATAQDTVYFAKEKAGVKGTNYRRSKELNIIKIAPLSFISGYRLYQ